MSTSPRPEDQGGETVGSEALGDDVLGPLLKQALVQARRQRTSHVTRSLPDLVPWATTIESASWMRFSGKAVSARWCPRFRG
jgi:hypothetical protein